jgi:hypothetical protein
MSWNVVFVSITFVFSSIQVKVVFWRQKNLLRGCTDPGAPNFNTWAFYDDGSCLSGTRVKFEVKAVGDWGAYQIEGPGLYYDDELAPHVAGSSIEDDDVHILTFTTWPQAVYTGRDRLFASPAPE